MLRDKNKEVEKMVKVPVKETVESLTANIVNRVFGALAVCPTYTRGKAHREDKQD